MVIPPKIPPELLVSWVRSDLKIDKIKLYDEIPELEGEKFTTSDAPVTFANKANYYDY